MELIPLVQCSSADICIFVVQEALYVSHLLLGVANRHCLINGTWMEPNATACSRNIFQKIRTTVSLQKLNYIYILML